MTEFLGSQVTYYKVMTWMTQRPTVLCQKDLAIGNAIEKTLAHNDSSSDVKTVDKNDCRQDVLLNREGKFISDDKKVDKEAMAQKTSSDKKAVLKDYKWRHINLVNE